MKRIEAIIPDDMARQVMILLADGAKEFHFYELDDPLPEALVRAKPPARIAAPKAAIQRQAPKAALPGKAANIKEGVFAGDLVMGFIRERGPLTYSQLSALGIEHGYSKSGFPQAATNLVLKGLLENADGLYDLPPAASRSN